MKRKRKIIHYSKRYSKKARTKRLVLKILLTLLILAAVASLGLIITGYLVGEPESSITSSDPSSTVSTSSEQQDTPSSEKEEISSSSDVSSEQSSSEPKVEQQPEEQTIATTVKIPTETLLSDADRAAFLKNAAEQGVQVVVFETKNTKGKLLYRSEIELAARCGAIDQNAYDLEAILSEIHEAGMKAAPYLAALQDPVAAHTDYGTSYRYGNTQYTWLDNAANKGGKAWLNPYLENTQQYLTDIVTELSDAGCDLIYVDKMRYPTAYTSKLNQGSSTVSRQDMLSELAGKMSAAARCEVIFCFEAESYFGKNTAQYNGTPSGIQGLQSVALNIDLSDFSGISSEFKDVDLSAVTPENLKLILDGIRSQCPQAVLYPMISVDAVSEDLSALFAEYGITTVWIK